MNTTDVRTVDSADVYVDDQPVATLIRLPDRVRLEYLDNAATDIATSLQRSTPIVETHAPGALPPFFSGLLPEGRRLSALRNVVKTSADDEFSLLLAVGHDTIGNVSIVPSGSPRDEPSINPVVIADQSSAIWSRTRHSSPKRVASVD